MIAFEVSLNGQRVCIAGADDLEFLSASVEATGKLGKEAMPLAPKDQGRDFRYQVGGMNSRKDVYMYWLLHAPVTVGDVIQVRIVETDTPDPPQCEVKV